MGAAAASSILRLLWQRRAVTAIEYALIAAIMAMVIVTGVALFGGNLGSSMTHVTDTLGSANAISASASPAAPASSGQSGSKPGAASTTGANNSPSAAGPTIQVNTANQVTQ